MYKPLADSTLQRMKKKEIIELLRIAEHNAKVAQEYVDQQAKNLKDWAPVVHGLWKHYGRNLGECSNCGEIVNIRYNYCPNCGAKMDGGDNNANKEVD